MYIILTTSATKTILVHISILSTRHYNAHKTNVNKTTLKMLTNKKILVSRVA